MRTEVPEVKRACFCFPLRYSLLLCAYARLIIASSEFYKQIVYSDDITNYSIYLYVFFLTTSGLDFVLVAIFIIGAHKKNVKLIRVFFIYDLVLLILMVLADGALFMRVIYFTYISDDIKTSFRSILWIGSVISCFIIFKGYILVLVKSEITKLSNTGDFRFVNNGAESECKMECQKASDEEKGLEKSDGETFESEDKYPKNIVKLTKESEVNVKSSQEHLGTENDSNDVIHSKSKNAYVKTIVNLANKSDSDMKYKKFGDED